MLIIRDAQMNALLAARRSEVVMRLAQRAAAIFPDQSEAAGVTRWRELVERTIKQAEGFGLSSERDFIRFVSFSAEFGWNFLEIAENEWMKAVLTDRRSSNPSHRLKRLFEEYGRRVAIAAENRRRREEFCR